MRILELTDGGGAILEAGWLEGAEPVHRQLRPHLPADYAAKMGRVCAGGARMAVAVESERVIGLAVYRWHENTADGVKCYVDDLVTDERCRSGGVGRALLQHVAQCARELGCDALMLDSGVQRTGAHKFYFREGLVITSFNFKSQIQ
jgi:GNAT superfamily N-acetyltransferase